MKLSAILLLAGALHVSAAGYSQKVSFTGKDVKLESIFSVIKQQTGYVLFCNTDLLDHAKPVTLSVKAMPLEDFLAAILKDQPLEYSVERKTIVISRKPLIDILLIPHATDTVMPVTGRIVTADGTPIPSATILIRGKSIGTTSDATGNFGLRTVSVNDVLTISSVGYEPREVKVDGRTMIIQLNPSLRKLNEFAVVSSGYQQQSKEYTTGSYAQPLKEVFDARVAPDVLSKLEGITSSLVFNRDLYGNTTMNIRAMGTIYANDQPLIVVDNFPYDGDIKNINPNDVESITILKDAASASIWGVRAGNGVIVITTKSGKLNQPLRVSLNANFTVFGKPDLKYNPEFLNSVDYIGVEKFLFGKQYYDGTLNDPALPAVSPVVEILAAERAGTISPAEAQSKLDAFSKIDYRDEKLAHLYQHAIYQQYALNLSGGGSKTSHYLSLGFDRTPEFMINNFMNRITVNAVNSFHPLGDKLEISAGINYIQSDRQSDLITNEMGRQRPPYTRLTDNNGNPTPIVWEYRPSLADHAEESGFMNWQFNPLKEIGLRMMNNRMNDIRFLTGIHYKIVNGLNAEFTYQYQVIKSESLNNATANSYFVRNLVNQFSILDNGMVAGYNYPKGGYKSLTNANEVSNNIRAALTYQREWPRHMVNIIAGGETRENVGTSNGYVLVGYDEQSGQAVPVSNMEYYPVYPAGYYSSLPVGVADLSKQTDRNRSLFSKAEYTFDRKYTVSASARTDGSNYFGVKTNQKSVPLWSAGAKWHLSNEDFYRNSWLPYLSLRASYGYNGNLDKSLTAVTTIYHTSGGELYPGLPHAFVRNVPNPELRWERVSILNLGADFAMKNGILSGSIEYYRKKGTDLISDAPVDPTTGVNQIRGNFAEMMGSGIDMEIKTLNVNRAFKWQTSFLFSFVTDKVTDYKMEMPPGYEVGSGKGPLPTVGKPVYSLFSYRWGGLDPATGDPMGYMDDKLSNDYPAVMYPTTRDNIVYHGTTRPKFYGGLSNTLEWKGIMLTTNISYKLGYYFRRSSINYHKLFTEGSGHKDFVVRWQKPGDEKVTNVPSMTFPANQNRDNFYGNSAIMVERGDHIRLRDVSLSYEIHPRWAGFHLNNLRIYAYTNNLGIIWRANSHNLDPDEVSKLSPTPRSFAFGITANF